MPGVVKVLWQLYWVFRWRFAAVMGLIFLSQILGLAGPYFIGRLVDGLFNKQPWQSMAVLVLLYTIVTIGEKVIVSVVREIFEIKKIDHSTIGHTVQHILTRVFSLSIGQHTSENSGKRHSIIKRGESALIDLTFSFLYNVLPMGVMIIVIAGALLVNSIPMGILFLVGVLTSCYMIYRLNSRNQADLRKIETLWNDDDKLEHEFIRNAPLVLINAQETRVFKETDESWVKLTGYAIPFWTRYTIKEAGQRLIAVITAAGVMALGLRFYYTGVMTPGEIIACIGWATSGLNQLSQLAMIQRQMIRQISSVLRLLELLNIETDVKVAPDAIKPVNIKGEIEFRNVTYGYEARQVELNSASEVLPDAEEGTTDDPDENVVLKNISFKINAGQRVAIVGRSGAGKSTMVKAILRASDPQSGQILIDGVDLRDLDLHYYRTHIGMVEQNVQLFDKSLRYNLTFGLNGNSGSVTNEQLDKVCATACVDRFTGRLEGGYDTMIGERGIK
ncbi:MAG TPA: ABC transporter ATP-binding protein, partial [Candidatus Binatia bacterium]|nr:ABC transporter ATP-binding protein [Candidatus Binatia bacterium]